ncbi:hypothetical protein GQR58_007124 [Nymphon striatum]|nr:hypothetical protein GQR58_007124 [Nymphon striatum]
MFEIYDLRPSDSRLVNPPSTSKAENNVEIQLKCRNGHIPYSNTYHALICRFGEWIWLNDQELTCTPIQCVVTEEDIDGKNYKNMFVGKTVSHNEVLDIKCRDNYQISDDNAETIHCKLGKFSPNDLPKCNPKMCATFKVENGLDVTEAVHGTTTEIQCYEDYIVDGSNSVLCQFGSWMPYIPSCIKGMNC